jgi:hypothetical protein
MNQWLWIRSASLHFLSSSHLSCPVLPCPLWYVLLTYALPSNSVVSSSLFFTAATPLLTPPYFDHILPLLLLPITSPHLPPLIYPIALASPLSYSYHLTQAPSQQTVLMCGHMRVTRTPLSLTPFYPNTFPTGGSISCDSRRQTRAWQRWRWRSTWRWFDSVCFLLYWVASWGIVLGLEVFMRM